MSIDIDDDLERRLRATCHAVIPHLLDEIISEPDAPSAPFRVTEPMVVLPDFSTVERSAHRRPAILTVAAAALVVLGSAAVWTVQQRSDQPASSVPQVSQSTTPSPAAPVWTVLLESPGSSVPCDAAGCPTFDRLPVAAGAADFYAGPQDLGVPHVTLDLFESLTRCAELSTDFASCQRLEGLAAMNLVAYSAQISVGTTFTDITPQQYATEWGPSQSEGPQQPATVRGHDAVVYLNEVDPAVVWQERPGVLVWVVVPPSMEDQLLSIAEAVRRLDGPATIPNRVMVAPLASMWDANDNSGDGLVMATAGGVQCVGLDYVDAIDCGEDIASRTIVRPRSSGETQVAGSTTADVSNVRIDIDQAEPIVVDTVQFASSASRFYSTVVPSGPVLSITWLDTQGNELSTAPAVTVAPDTASNTTVFISPPTDAPLSAELISP